MKKILSILTILLLLTISVSAESFLIQKGKTIHGLTSNFDGKGFGLTFGNVGTYGQTFQIYTVSNLKYVKIVPNEKIVMKPRQFNVMHFKKIKNPFDSYEVLSNLPQDKIKYYELQFKVPANKINSTSVLLDYNNTIFGLEKRGVKCDNLSCTFVVQDNRLGVFTIVK